MAHERPDVDQKAAALNADSGWYGTVAEIGAGQETARSLFRVGGAAGTVAKTISAYDMRFSDAIYGRASRYVSRERLLQMLDHEYRLLEERLQPERGEKRFFAFANTVAARSRSRPGPGRGWLGVRFQTAPGAAPTDILTHVQLHDLDNAQQQHALGVVGINLIHGAYALLRDPVSLIDGLVDGLSAKRLEVDMIHFAGPGTEAIDNRLMSVELVTRGLTEATMFTPGGEPVQPAERLYERPVLIQRGSFRPITRPVMRMLERAEASMSEAGQKPVTVSEMNQPHAPSSDLHEDQDLLARMEVLQSLGRNVLVTRFRPYYRVAELLRRYTSAPITMATGAATVERIFDPGCYAELEGGCLEAMGRLFKDNVDLLVWPYRDPETGRWVTAPQWRPEGALAHLYAYLLERGKIEALEADPEAELGTFPEDVRDMIERGEPGWRELVPEAAADAIESGRLAIRP